MSGGLLQRVAYTTDSKFLLCCSGVDIKIFSTTTGTQVRVLKGHTAEVTAIVHSPTLVLQAYSSSLDGRILLWDLDEAKVLRAICIGLSILDMVLDTVQPDVAFILTGAHAPADAPANCKRLADPSRVYSAALRISGEQAAWASTQLARATNSGSATDADAAGATGAAESFGSLARPWPAELTQLFKAPRGQALSAATCGGASTIVGALCGKILRLHDGASHSIIDIPAQGRREMSCLALSPTQKLAATGDESGRIHLHRIDGGSGSASARASEMHWHAQRVGSIAFSPDGLYLYSVGREGVLVSWQLLSTDRNFLPRLGAPLTSLACSSDGAHAALLGSDNSVRLVDLAANEVRLHVHGLLQAARMAPDGRTRSMVLHGGGGGGMLQWWSPLLDRQLQSLEVAPRNVTGLLTMGKEGSGKDGKEMRRALRSTAAAGGTALVQVSLACLSADGLALASVESRSEAELRQHSGEETAGLSTALRRDERQGRVQGSS